jgi:hypothetical protein
MSLVRVARFTDLVEAQVVESALQAAGIPVYLQNAQFGQTDHAAQYALGGFAVMVPEENAQAAAAFIREHRTAQAAPDAAEDDDDDLEPVPEDEVMAAPHHEEDEDWAEGRRRRRRGAFRWFIVIAVLGPGVVSIVLAAIRYLAKVVHGG